MDLLYHCQLLHVIYVTGKNHSFAGFFFLAVLVKILFAVASCQSCLEVNTGISCDDIVK